MEAFIIECEIVQFHRKRINTKSVKGTHNLKSFK